MGRIIIKSCILLALIASLLCGIYVWKIKSVNPPAELTYINEHDTKLSELIEGMNEKSLESTYQECYYKLNRYKAEEIFDEKAYNLQARRLVEKYSPLFISECYKSFREPKWNIEPITHGFIKSRIKELRQLSNNSDLGFNKQYRNIENTIDKYNDAIELSEKKYYKNIEVTIKREEEAKSFLEDTLLRNCLKLRDSLVVLPERIRQNHLKYLVRSVNQLKCDSIEEFMTFNANAKSLYGTKISEYSEHYANRTDTDSITRSMRDSILNKEYRCLEMYVQYALNIDNFDDYNKYDSMNNIVVYNSFFKSITIDNELRKINNILTNKYKKLLDTLKEFQRKYKVNDSIFSVRKNDSISNLNYETSDF